MVDELVTDPPRVAVVGSFIYVTLTSGDDEITYVLKQADALRLSVDLKKAVNRLGQS
jgi:hypothetical protein